jgi:hypothetical protein
MSAMVVDVSTGVATRTIDSPSPADASVLPTANARSQLGRL